MDPLAWIDDELGRLEEHDLRRTLRLRASAQTAEIQLDGRRVLNFGSNDYLGLAADPRLTQAVCEALKNDGWGSGASPLIVGRSAWHERLEQRIAKFKGVEAAIVFPSGFAANQGTIPALADRGDGIFSDALNHASIVDGCRLSRAATHVYRHGDLKHLATLLKREGPYHRRLIVTDTVFSMDGDTAPLADLCDLADRHHAMLMVDEAHATGVFGPRGRGLAEALGVEDRIDVRMGTMSKALGCAGGFVCGRQSLVNWLANRARSYVFSTAQPAAWCAAAIAAFDIVEADPGRGARLLERAKQLSQSLARRGWNVGESQSQIVPVIVGAPKAALKLSAHLWEQGCFVPAIRPPSVPEGRSLLRISLSAAHDEGMIDRLTDALGTCARSPADRG
jgi:8-amino-7-oxononanoate synthase